MQKRLASAGQVTADVGILPDTKTLEALEPSPRLQDSRWWHAMAGWDRKAPASTHRALKSQSTAGLASEPRKIGLTACDAARLCRTNQSGKVDSSHHCHCHHAALPRQHSHTGCDAAYKIMYSAARCSNKIYSGGKLRACVHIARSPAEPRRTL